MTTKDEHYRAILEARGWRDPATNAELIAQLRKYTIGAENRRLREVAADRLTAFDDMLTALVMVQNHVQPGTPLDVVVCTAIDNAMKAVRPAGIPITPGEDFTVEIKDGRFKLP